LIPHDACQPLRHEGEAGHVGKDGRSFGGEYVARLWGLTGDNTSYYVIGHEGGYGLYQLDFDGQGGHL
jgi:hypothetical protein